MRNFLSVVVGLIVGMGVNMALIKVNEALYAMPEGVSYEDQEAFQAWIDTLPAPAFLIVMAAHLGQALVGGWVAARLGSSRPVQLALVVGALSMVGGLMMLMTVQGPLWMWAEVPLYLLLAAAAGRVVQRSRA